MQDINITLQLKCCQKDKQEKITRKKEANKIIFVNLVDNNLRRKIKIALFGNYTDGLFLEVA